MKGIPERVISKKPDGSIHLRPDRADVISYYCLGVIFLFFGIMIFLKGILLIADGAIAGLIPTLFGLLLTIVAFATIRKRLLRIGPVFFITGTKTIRFNMVETVDPNNPGFAEIFKNHMIEFDQVDGVIVRSESAYDNALSSLGLVLKNNAGKEIMVEKGVPLWKAAYLARHLSGIIGCRAVVKSPSKFELSPIKLSAPWDPDAPCIPKYIKWLQSFAMLLMAIGFGAFMAGFSVATFAGNTFLKTEMPLGAPSGIAVDSRNRIYVGSRAYRRVQRYFSDGKFDRAWHVPGGKGDWLMVVDDRDKLWLRVGGFTYHMTNRETLAPVKQADSNPFDQSYLSSTRIFGKPSYELQSFPARVLRRDAGGTERTVISQGVFMFLVTAPFPAWGIGALGIILALVMESAGRRAAGKRIMGNKQR